MSQLSCISATLAARIIGAFGLSTSILMINVLMSDFFSRQDDNEFLMTVETWALLGLNWTKLVVITKIQKQVQMILVCFIGYSVLYLLASAFLAAGTIFKKPKYALPWLYIQMVSIVDQIIAISIRLTDPQIYDINDATNWHMPLSSVYLVVAAYFWMIVFSARQEWLTNVRNPYDIYNLEFSNSVPVDANVPKTPSFLAQNLSIFESPEPHINVKYDVV